ncbi:MAG: prepilin peptidase [Patescibacteria group bacterium]
MVYLLLFLLGLCVGSFLNVVIDRLSREESLGGRSYCENCQKSLAWFELLPVLSWFWLRGKCRRCKSNISFYYPLVELLTGLLFSVGIFLSFPRGFSLSFPSVITVLYLLVIISVLTAVFFTDLKYGVIPDQLILIGVFSTVAYRLLLIIERIGGTYLKLKNDVNGLGPYLLRTDYLALHLRSELVDLLVFFLSGLILAFIFWLIVKLTREKGMGTGDVTLGFLIGLISGFPGVVVSVFLGFLFGSIVSILLIILRRKRFGQTVPLGPFLIIALLITLFFGDSLIKWYINLL